MDFLPPCLSQCPCLQSNAVQGGKTLSLPKIRSPRCTGTREGSLTLQAGQSGSTRRLKAKSELQALRKESKKSQPPIYTAQTLAGRKGEGKGNRATCIVHCGRPLFDASPTTSLDNKVSYIYAAEGVSLCLVYCAALAGWLLEHDGARGRKGWMDA